MIIDGLLIIGALSLLVLIFAASPRHATVYKFRARLLKSVGEVNLREIESGEFKQWIVRYEVLDSISYRAMVWQFWRPLRSFYTGTILEDLAKEI